MEAAEVKYPDFLSGSNIGSYVSHNVTAACSFPDKSWYVFQTSHLQFLTEFLLKKIIN